MYIYTCIYIYIYMYVCIYLYTYTYIHTYIHIYIYVYIYVDTYLIYIYHIRHIIDMFLYLCPQITQALKSTVPAPHRAIDPTVLYGNLLISAPVQLEHPLRPGLRRGCLLDAGFSQVFCAKLLKGCIGYGSVHYEPFRVCIGQALPLGLLVRRQVESTPTPTTPDACHSLLALCRALLHHAALHHYLTVHLTNGRRVTDIHALLLQPPLEVLEGIKLRPAVRGLRNEPGPSFYAALLGVQSRKHPQQQPPPQRQA